MTTHQSISGQTDDDLLQRMIRTHPNRFGDAYWEVFDQHVLPRLGLVPTVVDLGCGPGLWLQDVAKRVPGARLHGFDLTSAMIDYAKTLDYGGSTPTLDVLDIVEQPLPFADGSVDLIDMTAVLHLFNDPFGFLAKVKRALKPTSVFLLRDWVRRPLVEYLARAQDNPDDTSEEARRRRMALFPYHNRYTVEDWVFLLIEAGFEVIGRDEQAEAPQRMFAAVPKG
jgi:SAM-dependent methyltransferase